MIIICIFTDKKEISHYIHATEVPIVSKNQTQNRKFSLFLISHKVYLGKGHTGIT